MPKHLLIFDDDPDFSALLTDAFSGEKIDVVVTASPTSGLELFRQGTYDLILTDNRMPGMEGVDLIARLREIDSTIPIIFMSGFMEPVTLAKAQALNVTEVFTKPLNIMELIQKVHTILGLDV